jgi:drug/metabolite transporter (DMT)-like permease
MLALGTVYVVWGSTYLAIRVAVETMPPFLFAATRFLVAGAALYAWAIRRGDVEGDRPGPAQWRAALVVGGLLLAGGNGLVSWGEQTVVSGLAALLIATVPLWMVLLGRLLLGERLGPTAAVGLALGFGGVAALVRPIGAAAPDPLGASIILLAALCWATGSILSRRLPLPKRALVATGMEMLAGGGVLAVMGVATGELGRFDPAAVSSASLAALAYLVVFGSLIAFTAYVWLLREAPPAVVSTYAYVNPVVAVFLGWALLGEPVYAVTVLAGAIIVVAVGLLVTSRRPTATATVTDRDDGVPNAPVREAVGEGCAR